jgi:tRNA nucleotidyltransferase (CCA-adding enzyme)
VRPKRALDFDFRDRALFVSLFGSDVYAVGGCVRDALRGLPAGEVDLLVARRPLGDIIALLKPHGKVDLVGRSFGVIKFTISGTTYDIALPRTDRAESRPVRGHKDILVTADPDLPVEKDLERRDFRCNSIAVRLADGLVLDPFRGRRDIEGRLLRVTNAAAFPEDPLRVLRAARFAAALGYSVDPSIYRLARTIDLTGLSVERVNEELFKILLSDRPSTGLDELFKLGTLRQLFPELYALTLVIQDSVFHPEKDDFGHHTVWHHTKLTVDQARRLAGPAGLDASRTMALLLAALYHDVGKAETTQWEFKRGRMVVTSAGHDTAGERLARKAFVRSKIFSWNGFPLRRIALVLIRTHHRASELWMNREEVTRKAFNKLAAEAEGEIELVVALDAADRAGRRDRPAVKLDREAVWLLKRFEELRVSRETIRPLILGRDLLRLGVPPGPEMGRILKDLYDRQLDNAFETREEGLIIAKKLVEGPA